MSGLEKVEDLLAKGDVEGAMKELDQLGNEMEKMLSGLKQTAGVPDEKAQELMKEMLAFKKSLEDVQAEQQRVAKQTDALKAEYRKKMGERMKDAAEKAKRLEQLAKEARQELAKTEPGVSLRAEGDFAHAEEALKNLERALGMRDFDAALDSVKNAMPAMQRLAMSLEEDAAMAERYQELTGKDPARIREAEQHAMNALPKAAQVREELEKLFPDPRQVMSGKEQQRLGELSKEQSQLEQKAGELQQQLGQLMEQAPIFPPSASGQLGESRGHMGQAAMELGQRNPQRGHGEQQLAMDALDRFQKGLEQMAKQGGGSGGQGFPFPFSEQGGGQTGDGSEPSQEKVEIPGAEAHKVPEEFRKDLLDAMRQGAPDRYEGEVKRYYEELVK
jgi:predicted transcriptional regulator